MASSIELVVDRRSAVASSWAMLPTYAPDRVFRSGTGWRTVKRVLSDVVRMMGPAPLEDAVCCWRCSCNWEDKEEGDDDRDDDAADTEKLRLGGDDVANSGETVDGGAASGDCGGRRLALPALTARRDRSLLPLLAASASWVIGEMKQATTSSRLGN
jgi:hypothetical protein